MLALDDEEENEESEFNNDPIAEVEIDEESSRLNSFPIMNTNGSKHDLEGFNKSSFSHNALSEDPPKTNQEEDGNQMEGSMAASFDTLIK